MVDITVGGYLFEAFIDAGRSKPGAMGGDIPLDWRDIRAFRLETQAIAEPWEARALVSMSLAYVSEKAAGVDPRHRSPMEAGG